MTDQPEALRVAAELDALALKACGPKHLPLERVAALFLQEQHAEIERLREANEALRRDAERYRWLLNGGGVGSKPIVHLGERET